jgi:uncharacterized protein YceK
MKKIFILLLVVALFAGCGREQLLQPVDAGISETIVSVSKQTQSQDDTGGVLQSIEGVLIVLGMFACQMCGQNS